MHRLPGDEQAHAQPVTDPGGGLTHLFPTAALVAHAERWRPWRAYAVQHLWSILDHPIATLAAAMRATSA